MAEKMIHEQAADMLFGRTGDESPEVADEIQPVDGVNVDHQDDTALQAEMPEPEESTETKPVEVPQSLDELADKAGLKKADLYKLSIPMGKGEDPISLGEFKDRVQDLRAVDALRADTEDERASFQAERLKYQQELQVVAAALQKAQQTGQLDDDTLKQASQAYQQQVERENQTARAVAPELAKPETVDKIESTLAKWGAPKGVMESGIPAWMQLALNRLTILENRLEQAKAAQAKPKPKAAQPAPGRQDRKAAVVRAAKAGKTSDTEAARALIFGS